MIIRDEAVEKERLIKSANKANESLLVVMKGIDEQHSMMINYA